MPSRRRFQIITPSFLAFTREARRTPGYSFLDWLHGLVYARWTYLYIGIGIGEHPWAKRLAPLGLLLEKLLTPRPEPGAPVKTKEPFHIAETYHGKVVPLSSAKQLVLVNEEINLPDLEQVIPFKKARSIILQNPDHIVVLDCPCRTARTNPCLPLDVCLVVGEPFAAYILEHTPEKARAITRDEAVAILEAEDQRGHVHHAFFKDAMLGRFYAICNCCSCCCGAMQAQRNGDPMLISSGYIAQVNEDLCIGCETCAEYCQFDAISYADFTSHINAIACMGCGICVGHCEQEAITLLRAPEKGEPLEIFALMDLAAAKS